jgi:hypothetical protein
MMTIVRIKPNVSCSAALSRNDSPSMRSLTSLMATNTMAQTVMAPSMTNTLPSAIRSNPA